MKNRLMAVALTFASTFTYAGGISGAGGLTCVQFKAYGQQEWPRIMVASWVQGYLSAVNTRASMDKQKGVTQLGPPRDFPVPGQRVRSARPSHDLRPDHQVGDLSTRAVARD